MNRQSESVAVFGAGTLSGIAAPCAQADCRVLLPDTILRPTCPTATRARCSLYCRPPSTVALAPEHQRDRLHDCELETCWPT